MILGGVRLFAEVACQKAVEPGAVASFVLSHLVNCVMNGIVTEFLGSLSNCQLAFASPCLCLITFLQISLCVPDDVPEKLGEFRSVLCLLESVSLECLGNLRIAFPLCLTAHGKVHPDLAALAVEMIMQSLENLRVVNFPISEMVLASPLRFAFIFFDLYEFASRRMALRAFCWRVLAFIDVTAH